MLKVYSFSVCNDGYNMILYGIPYSNGTNLCYITIVVITVNFDGGEGGLDKMVIIAIVVAVIVVALVVSAVAAIFVMRRRRRRLNKADNSPKTGHINHMMSPK